jgi:hypothetical protein
LHDAQASAIITSIKGHQNSILGWKILAAQSFVDAFSFDVCLLLGEISVESFSGKFNEKIPDKKKGF